MRKLTILLLVLSALAACGPQDESLPTLARLPSSTATPLPVTAITAAAQQPTASPSATATDPATDTATAATSPTAPASPTVTTPPTLTWTPSATITVTSSPTPTDLPTIPPDERPLLALALTANAATVLPTDYQVPDFGGMDVTLAPTTIQVISTEQQQVVGGDCDSFPPGGFGVVYQNNPTLATQLGCPSSATEQQIPAAWQSFEDGTMLWLDGTIFVLFDIDSLYQRYADTFVEGVDPERSSETPPQGLQAPVRGFLKVWSSNAPVRDGLGWATNSEQGVTATTLNFENGRMVWLPGRGDILVLIGAQAGIWRSFPGTF